MSMSSNDPLNLTEVTLIGAMINSPDKAEAMVKTVDVSDFSDPFCREAFAVMSDFVRGFKPIEQVLVAQAMANPDPAATRLKDICATVQATSNSEQYVKLVKDASLTRRVIDLALFAQEEVREGADPATILNSLHADIEDLQRANRGGKGGIEVCSLKEFMQRDYRQDFLINWCITEGQPGVISAKSKCLKTTIAMDAALSIASGTDFLGNPKWSVPVPSRVGFLSGESGGSTLQETARRIAVSKGLHVEEVENFYIETVVPHLRKSEGLQDVEWYIEDNELRCLFIDPAYMAFMGADTKDESKMAEILVPISHIIDRTGCTIVMLNHNRKSPAVQGVHYSEPTMDDIQGTGFQQWSRFFILLNKFREWNPETGEHWLWLKMSGSVGYGSTHVLHVREGRLDQGGRVWEPTLLPPSEVRRLQEEAKATKQAAEDDKKQAEGCEKICKVLTEHEAGLTLSRIQKYAGVYSRYTKVWLDDLVEKGGLEKTKVKVGNKKTPEDGYKLAASPDYSTAA